MTRHLALLAKSVAACALAMVLPAQADQQRTAADYGGFLGLVPQLPISARASLDFSVNIEKFIFLRVGTGGSFTGAESGTGPAANGTVDTVSFTASAIIPAVPTAATNGVNKTVNWSGGAPTFAASAPVTLPVEVRSNAGQVRITVQATTPLTSGSNTIPMTAIAITSSSAQLPAPVVPATGVSLAVNVAVGGVGTAAAPTLLTYRTANWTFAYTPSASVPAGVYNGQITFTASAP